MNLVTELEEILADEQRCLLSGAYDDLAGLAERKTALAARLSAKRGDLGEDACRRLKNKAAHNEALLRAAQRGIQAAIAQLRQFTSGEHQSTYSRDGMRRPLSRSPSALTQKL